MTFKDLAPGFLNYPIFSCIFQSAGINITYCTYCRKSGCFSYCIIGLQIIFWSTEPGNSKQRPNHVLCGKKAGVEWETLWFASPLFSATRVRERPRHKPRNHLPEGPHVSRGPARRHTSEDVAPSCNFPLSHPSPITWFYVGPSSSLGLRRQSCRR